MVRINLIEPRYLSDQHLVAEYNEILMLVGCVKKNQNIKYQPLNYCLGKGHILFFKNKLKYLEERFKKIKKEMKFRGFKTNKNIEIKSFNEKLKKNWKPLKKDKEIIKRRIIEKIKLKPDYYRFHRKKRATKFLVNMIKNAR
jgi:deoxyribonuclease (pyrimidine dimer)